MNIYQVKARCKVLENNMLIERSLDRMVVATSIENAIRVCKKQYPRGLSIHTIDLLHSDVLVDALLVPLSEIEPETE